MSFKRQCNVREMLHFVVLLNLIFGVSRFVNGSAAGDNDFGAGLISSLRNDANLDLSVDEEYEDLRAELLAYHTALASLTGKQSRRSMMTTPCWQQGGVCINVNLCKGYRFLTEVPGCKNRMNVCCFAWNKFRVKDYKPKGISVIRLPWSIQYKFGGKGVMDVDDEPQDRRPGGTDIQQYGQHGNIKEEELEPENTRDSADSLPNKSLEDPIVILNTM